MTAAERLLRTLNFEKLDEGAFVETFFPWTLTTERWRKEGLDLKFTPEYLFPSSEDRSRRYFDDMMAEPVYEYEQSLGLDGVKRMSFRIPFKCFDDEILEETEEYVLKRDQDGWIRKYYKMRVLVENIQPVIREEEHLTAFYEMPELLHEINTFILEKYLEYFDKIFNLIQPEVILFEEDLSGVNGPMISPAMFDKFVGAYYKKLIPFLKQKGVKNVFVDTDGDFRKLIPNFIAAGVDGFLPMDVNAGMDIVAVRKEFPDLKFIGAFNKLAIADGKEAIDKEFERILPVIRQGGFIPGTDHQAAPSTSFEDYKYYLNKLKEYMKHTGADCIS